ncbi:MAG: hypothetical protein NVSMB31_05270 [Vulcanimicrobiaceae bacterium]
MRERFAELARFSASRIRELEEPQPHRILFAVMALFYLTHPKVYEQGLNTQAKELLAVLC